jgi:hypothetical protein
MIIPTTDGQVVRYQAVHAAPATPRVYYVNGIQTDGVTHAKTTTLLSILTERKVFGVYNATAGKGVAGMAEDLAQCLKDWGDSFGSKLAEMGNWAFNGVANRFLHFVNGQLGRPAANPVNLAGSIRERIPEGWRVYLIETWLGTHNAATASLFRQLRIHRGQFQFIVAHSQGNLITCAALWAMVFAFGEASLARLRVYSLASPAPAWPLGIRLRRKVYGFSNDVVTLADPHNWTWITSRLANGIFGRTAGDWRQFGPSWLPGLDGHDLSRNMFTLNFARSIRRDLGLPPLTAAVALP